MKCFKCENTLEVIDHSNPAQCYNSVFFTSTGNYGSMFDPFDADEVRITICDQCIIENANNILAVNTPYFIKPEPEYSTWKYVNSVRKI